MKEKDIKSPWLAKRLLSWFLNHSHPDTMIADFEEVYREKARGNGHFSARCWYWFQIISTVPSFVNNSVYWSHLMFRNYFKIALRNILKQKGYSIINVLGLALGIAMCILILCWAQYETSFDTFHEKSDSLYLIRSREQYGSELFEGSGSVPALGPALKTEYPEVVNAVRLTNGQRETLMAFGEKKFKENIQMADASVFELFTFSFTKGNPQDAFSDPYVVVMSEKIASKFFDDSDPVGKIITLDNQYDLRVVGVMKDIPRNSTIRFDVWVPIQMSREWYRENYIDTWYNMAFRTYVELADGVSYDVFNGKIKDRVRRMDPDTIIEPFLYPFKDVYLKLWGGGDQIRTFVIIALFVLVIACINFMNLTTARSARRAKEVGLRKVVGAQRNQLMKQFFGESMLITVFSLLVAILLAELFLPTFRALTERPLQTRYFGNIVFLAGIVGITLLAGILAGIYPALFLSGFRPIRVLRDTGLANAKGGWLRKILVVVQFALSIMLIIGTTVIYNQTRFMKTKQLGFDQEHLVYIRVEGDLEQNYESMKTELLRQPNIQNVTVTSHSPTGIYWNGQDWEWEGRDPAVNPLVTYFYVDEDAAGTFKMELAEGRFHSKAFSSSGSDVVINERFASIMGTESPVGKRISHDDESYRIIGVIKDFHYKPVYREIGPIILFSEISGRTRTNFMFIRIRPVDIQETIDFLKKTALKFNPEFPFEYRFLDEDYDRMYRWAEQMGEAVRIFAVMAIFISCLGLFGLAAFMAEQRTKEIGVRKVLGASVSGVVLLLTKEFTKWVLVSSIIAWPIAYWIMHRWLQDFAYRTAVGLGTLVLSTGMALFVAWVTVSYQSLKVARTNPVDALRYE